MKADLKGDKKDVMMESKRVVMLVVMMGVMLVV